MITKEEAKRKIAELVERFEEQYASYKNADYNETLTRRDFIDPFFKALGWDIDNEQGYAEAYREVIHEDRVKVGSATKAPDYSFRIGGGKRLFFVEAKKPSVAVKDDIPAAYQVRRYGWSAKLPVSIITDFDEFSIYDCTKKPVPTDKASVARIKYIQFKDYLNEFDFIWDTFSKEKVLKGSFDKFVQGTANKKGTATVDKEFLQSLDNWRTYLATSISWNNKELDEDEINFAVQQTLDRIIFLRIAEDRSVEPYGNLKNALTDGEYYQNLFGIFREADDKYNSGLFDFKKDTISPQLKIDNKVIKSIINELYYPLSPYEFSVLSVEILGSAYEQFLGKVIRITPAHHAKIEEKPEVRKAGGVYYTPQYIVEYIVKNTVGKLIGSPIEGAKLLNSPLEGGKGGVISDRITHRNTIIPYNPKLKAFARELRKNSTLSEILLWQEIKEEKLGVQFHRQVPIDEFIVDFYCHELMLAIEIDGSSHNLEEAFNKDELRQQKLENLGVRFLRFDDLEVKKEMLNVINAIELWIEENKRILESGEETPLKSPQGDTKRGAASNSPLEGGRGVSPKEISKLKIVDPACGSGSFLIGAYQYLLDWHKDYYHQRHAELVSASGKKGEIPKRVRNDFPLTPEGNLTTAEKKRILLNNIYGVDIDVNAVEVTKLSLLLKCMEGETQASITHQLSMFHERVLPTLDNNIKSGNSLIDTDYYDSQLDFGDERKIKPFNWQKAFPDVFKQGGFDAVIGNPPYVRIQTLKETAPDAVNYYIGKYLSATKGNFDLYVVFVEKGLKLLNIRGKLGFILPHKFFISKYGQPLRKILSLEKNLEKIVHFGTEQVFLDATTYTCLLFLSQTQMESVEFIKVTNIPKWITENHEDKEIIENKTFTSDEWNIQIGNISKVLSKVVAISPKLIDLTEKIYQGLITGADKVFILTQIAPDKYYSEATEKEHKIEKELMHPLCKGSVNIKRYHISDLTKSILFPYELINGKNRLIPLSKLETDYPNAYKYLLENRRLLEEREKGKWKNEKWFSFGRTQNLNEMENQKILTPSIAAFASFTFDENGDYYFVGSGGGGGGGYGITLISDINLMHKYVLGILNSKLIDIYIKSVSSSFRGGYYAYNRQYIEQIPIQKPNKSTHDEIVTLVDQLLQLNREKAESKLKTRTEQLQNKIDWCEQRINRIVYQLYGLTEEEIKIVERI